DSARPFGATDQRDIPIRAERHAGAEAAGADLFFAGQLWPLLRPRRALALEHPNRADPAVVIRLADGRCAAVPRERDGSFVLVFRLPADLFPRRWLEFVPDPARARACERPHRLGLFPAFRQELSEDVDQGRLAVV